MLIFSGFFTYKDFRENFQSQMFTPVHFIYMAIVVIALVALLLIFRKANHKKIDIYLKIITFYVFIQEIVKIVWESYYDITVRGSFNYEGLLPLYLCSMFMYVLPFVSFGKGKIKEYGLAFLTSVGIIGGISNVFYLNILNAYPIISFPSFVSIIYHFLMTFTGLLLLTSKYYIPNKYTPFKSLFVIALFSLIVIPVNYILKSKGYNNDYMLYMHGYGLPFATKISSFLIDKNVQFLFIFFIDFLYLISAYIVYLVYCLCARRKIVGD